MEKFLFACVVALLSAFTTVMLMLSSVSEYVKTTEELLKVTEEMCEYNDIPWGDTICETDVWEDYCEARKSLGLNYLRHYSKR